MKYQINQDVIDAADRCNRNHACLDSDVYVPCEVQNTVGKDVVFIDPSCNPWCEYRLNFASDWVCTCPVRKELHKIHGV